MKKAWSLFFCTIGCALIAFALRENNDMYINFFFRLIASAAVLSFSGFLFKAKPAAAAAGMVLAFLAFYEIESWYFIAPLSLLAFAGWSKLQQEELEMAGRRANGLDDDYEEMYEYDDSNDDIPNAHEKQEMPNVSLTQMMKPEEKKPNLAEAQPVRKESKEELYMQPVKPIRRSIFKKISNWWFFLSKGTKVAICLGIAVIFLIVLVCCF